MGDGSAIGPHVAVRPLDEACSHLPVPALDEELPALLFCYPHSYPQRTWHVNGHPKSTAYAKTPEITGKNAAFWISVDLAGRA